jgi:colanic acid/amylovoran biosynthesis glycosyltransferase
MANKNICVTLPGALGYSETFMQAHRERLSPFINSLDDFPIDIDYVLSRELCDDDFRRRLRSYWYSYGLNPVRRISLRKFFNKNNIGVVLAEYGLTGVGVLKTCKELDIPLVVHFHGADAYVTELINRLRDRYKSMFDYASAIISVSRHMTEQLIKLGAPSEKIHYNPYGVELDKFEQTCRLTAPLQVVAVGRFVEKKAPYLSILAFRNVLDRLPEARLVMVGAGPLHEVCAKLIHALHIEHAVELKGVLDHNAVAALMRQSRVFIQHSLVSASGDSEGTPVAILEACASGLPVVSTRHAGITDVVIEGSSGFLVDEGDIDNMAEYVYRLLSNPILANQMGTKAREHIMENYDMESSIGNLRSIVENCI